MAQALGTPPRRRPPAAAGARPWSRPAPQPPSAGTPPAPGPAAIAGLGVDAAVDPVGVRPDGQMAPARRRRPGRLVPVRPGPGAAGGSAVLAGHVDDAEQGLGALAPLREVAGRHRGRRSPTPRATATRWRVVCRELIEKQVAAAGPSCSAATGPPRLALVTCGGPFLPELRSYRDNVVVVAEPVP